MGSHSSTPRTESSTIKMFIAAFETALAGGSAYAQNDAPELLAIDPMTTHFKYYGNKIVAIW